MREISINKEIKENQLKKEEDTDWLFICRILFNRTA
jgi:hypothetical protein